MEYRIEHDSMGEVQVPAGRYWAAQTQRSHENFPIGVGIETMPREITHAFGILKKAAAMANHQLRPEKMTDEKLEVISQACDEVASGSLNDHFPLVVWQTGSGTQSNMNANEVIANRAIEILGGEKGDYSIVHPNDHVNMAQSTNDVIPSAGKLPILELLPGLLKELERLHVRDILRENPSVRITASVDELLDTIVRHNFVPVVDDLNSFIGIVTRQDIIRCLAEEKEAAPVLRKIV